MISPLSNYLKRARGIEIDSEAEKKCRELKGSDGLPLLLPQLLEMIKEEMFRHDVSENLHTFHHMPVDHLVLLIDNSKSKIRIMKAMTKDEFRNFIVHYNEYFAAEARH